MSLADEIQKLQRLRDGGAMTEDEFTRAKSLVLHGQGSYQAQGATPPIQAAYSGAERPFPGTEALHRMARSTNDRWLGGVCGGLASVTGLPSWVIRVLFSLGLVAAGVGMVPYVLLWIFMPSEETLAATASKPVAAFQDDLA